jgi:hypothetical protein
MHLGACQCPNAPHTGLCSCAGAPHAEGDWIELRTELGAGDMEPISGGNIDALQHLIVGWNLLDNDGSKAPVDRVHIDRLFADTFEAFEKFTSDNIRTAAVPNVPAAPSRSSSRASGSPTPIRKKAG